MLLRRPLLSKSASLHRHLFHSAALPSDPDISPTNLDGFPKPDPKFAEIIKAIPRSESGKKISANERKVGRVPSIVFEQKDGQFGGNKRLISVQTNQIKKLVNHCGRSFFLSRLFDLKVQSDFDSDEVIEMVRVLPRKIHLHPVSDNPLNITFIRAPSDALLKVDIPIVLRGEEVSPGLRKGSYLNFIKRTVKFICPADFIPPYIEVDVSELDAGQKIVMGQLNVHPSLKLVQSRDEPVIKIMSARISDQKKSK